MPCSTELNQNFIDQRTLLPIACSVCALCSYLKPLVRLICNHEPMFGLRPIQFVPCAVLLGLSQRLSNDPWIGILPSIQSLDQSLSIAYQLFIPVTSIDIAVHRKLRVHFYSSTTLVLQSIFIALRPKFVCCVLGLSWGHHQHSHPLYIKNLILARHDSRHCRLSSQPSNQSLSTVCQDLGSLSMTLDVFPRSFPLSPPLLMVVGRSMSPGPPRIVCDGEMGLNSTETLAASLVMAQTMRWLNDGCIQWRQNSLAKNDILWLVLMAKLGVNQPISTCSSRCYSLFLTKMSRSLARIFVQKQKLYKQI